MVKKEKGSRGKKSDKTNLDEQKRKRLELYRRIADNFSEKELEELHKEIEERTDLTGGEKEELLKWIEKRMEEKKNGKAEGPG